MFTVRGLNEFENRLVNAAHVQFPAALEQAIIRIAQRLQAKVKKRTPYRSGNLRRNWFLGNVVHDAEGYSIEIFNNVEYASHVEWGHNTNTGGFVPGRFMLKISLDEIERELPRYLRNELKRIFRGLSL